MDWLPYGAQTPFLRLLHPEMERDYEAETDEESDDFMPTPLLIFEVPYYCPYCGGRGSKEWFEKHEHENPFGDEA